MKSVYVRVPASSGNLGPGFDVLGAALGLHNELVVRRVPGRGASWKVEGEGVHELGGRANVLGSILKGLGGIEVRLVNRIPLARGLGSSGAARLAGHAAALLLRGRSVSEALELAAREEGHADNAAASCLGGLTASLWREGVLWSHSWRLPKDLRAVLCVPERRLSTAEARRVLPRKVPMKDAVANLGALAALLAGLGGDRREALAFGTEDRLHEPYRERLIPGLAQVRAAALRAGALGACLSGAGPTVLALADRSGDPERIGAAMAAAFRKAGERAASRVVPFDGRGMVVETA